MYEFYDKIERRLAEEERSSQEGDKIELEKEKAALDWAEQEERKELEALKAHAAEQEQVDPAQDPKNVAWMEDQLKAAQEMFGEDFGEDIRMNFDE